MYVVGGKTNSEHWFWNTPKSLVPQSFVRRTTPHCLAIEM